MALFCVRLRELDATVLGIADAPAEELAPELRDALAEYYQVRDMHDMDALIRALGYFTHRYGKIDRLESLNEYWLETDARLRTEFNIMGIRVTDIERIKRKSAMKRVFEEAAVPTPRGRVCATEAETRAFVREVGYPVIAKPDVGVGAAQTYRIDDGAGVKRFLSGTPDVDYLLEEFIDGALVSYDGLVDRAGRVVFEASIGYGVPVLDSVFGADMHFWIDRTIPDDLVEAGRRVVEAFGVRERPFHIEFFRRADGSLVALEVNMRQPGGPTVDMWNYAGEFDFCRMWAEVVVHGTAELASPRPYAVLWAGRKDGRTYRLHHDDVLLRFSSLIVHSERIPDVFALAIGNVGYLLRGPDLEPLQAAAREIMAVA
jgi:predicted ATP-grasp superfamily ATP-dependent carboligase